MMEIIAWDITTNAAIEPIRLPVDGECARFKTADRVEIKQFFQPEELAPLTPIVITSVTGALLTSSDFTRITCNELTDITISGTLDIPDRMFAMPIKRSDGKLTLFGVSVVDGKFDAVLNFPTSGQYQYTDIEANTDLPEPMFKVEPIKIDVLRKTGA